MLKWLLSDKQNHGVSKKRYETVQERKIFVDICPMELTHMGYRAIVCKRFL